MSRQIDKFNDAPWQSKNLQVATGKSWQSSIHSKHDTTILQQDTIRTNTSHVFHFINFKSLGLIQESLNSWSWSRPLCVWTPHLMSAVTGRKWNNQNRHRCEGHWLKSTGWDVRRVQAKRWLLDGLCDRLFPWSFPTSSKKWYWKNLTTISNIQRRKMLSIDRRESIEADTDPCRSSSSHRRFDSLLEARAANQMKCHLATNLKIFEMCWNLLSMSSDFHFCASWKSALQISNANASLAAHARFLTTVSKGSKGIRYVQEGVGCHRKSFHLWPVSIRCAPHDWNAMKSPVNVQRYQSVTM